MLLDAFHFAQPQFGRRPERFDTVHMRGVIGQFMVALLNPNMPGITDINALMIITPVIRMNQAIEVYLTAYDWLSVCL